MGASLLLLDLAQWHDLLNQNLNLLGGQEWLETPLHIPSGLGLWELARCRLLLLLLGGQEWFDSHLHIP